MRLVHVLFEADASQAVLGFPVFFFDVVNIIRDDKRNIKLVYVPYGRTDEISLLEKIKQAFRSVHIYINSDTEKDAEIIRQRFYDWRFRQSQSVIAQK
jgi:hypothetical protein